MQNQEGRPGIIGQQPAQLVAPALRALPSPVFFTREKEARPTSPVAVGGSEHFVIHVAFKASARVCIVGSDAYGGLHAERTCSCGSGGHVVLRRLRGESHADGRRRGLYGAGRRARLWRLRPLRTSRPLWGLSRGRPIWRLLDGASLPSGLPSRALRTAVLAELRRRAWTPLSKEPRLDRARGPIILSACGGQPRSRVLRLMPLRCKSLPEV
jgi:hypothetical protein